MENTGPSLILDLLSRDAWMFDTPETFAMVCRRWQVALMGATNAHRPVPIRQRIKGDETALLVVDMQRAFLDEGAPIEVPQGREIIGNINRLAATLRVNGGLVVFLRYLVDEQAGLLPYFESYSYLSRDRGSPLDALSRDNHQFEIHPGLEVLPQDRIVDKRRYSAVQGSGIVETLRLGGIRNVLVTGVTTDVCAGNTAEALMQEDFYTIMVWDGTAALDRAQHEFFLARFFGLYGDVMPTEEVVNRLTRKNSTEKLNGGSDRRISIPQRK